LRFALSTMSGTRLDRS